MICWHVPTGPEPSGSLADDSDLPRSLKPAGTCGLGQSCWDWREDPAAFTTGLGPEIMQRLQKTLERQYPYGQSYSIHPRNASWGPPGVARCAEYCRRERFRKTTPSISVEYEKNS